MTWSCPTAPEDSTELMASLNTPFSYRAVPLTYSSCLGLFDESSESGVRTHAALSAAGGFFTLLPSFMTLEAGRGTNVPRFQVNIV